MSVIESRYKAGDLSQGCILATIAHAIWLIKHPELVHEQSWDGSNYNVQDTMGSLGTITFGSEGTVAAFFDVHSPRNPFRSGTGHALAELLAGMPASLRALAERETLQYLLQEYKGTTQPVITAAFWSEGESVVAAEQWDQVLSNGAHLAKLQLLGAAALGEWQKLYKFNSREFELVRSLFSRKMSNPDETVILTASEADTILTDAPGVDESKALLRQIRILAEDGG
jgi:hypothetical protein